MQDFVVKADVKDLRQNKSETLVASYALNHAIQVKLQMAKALSQNGHTQKALVSLKNSMNPVEL